MMRMRTVVLAGALLGAGLVPCPAVAAEPVSRTFAAPLEQVWRATHDVLKSLGWDVDEADRAAGWIVTDDETVDFKDFGVYGEGTRHLLRIRFRAAEEGRTTVSVARELFREERILWTKSRKPLATTDQRVEEAVLDALARRVEVDAGARPAPPPSPVPGPAPEPRAAARGEPTVRVRYVVKGTAPAALLSYRNAWGGTEQTTVRLPWEVSFDARAGDPLSLSARNEGASGSVTCEILVDGSSRTRATSSGAGVTAECSQAAGAR